MENQHREIKTYRELTLDEIWLMNRIKQMESDVAALHEEIRVYVSVHQPDNLRRHRPLVINDYAMNLRTNNMHQKMMAESLRQCAMSRTSLEQGFTHLVRAVAAPDSPWLGAENRTKPED
jgi:hypothetical protein